MAIYDELDELEESLEGLARTTVENLQRSQSNSTKHGDLAEVESQNAIRDVFVTRSFVDSVSNVRINTFERQASLETLGWNIPNTSYTGNSLDISSNTTESRELAFKPDGTKLYVLDKEDGSNNTIRQYDLFNNPWDISEASYELGSTISNTENNEWKGIVFKPDGSKFYIINGNDSTNSGLVEQYDLGSPWDITQESFSFKTFNDESFTNETSWEDGFFKPDGTKLYLVGNDDGNSLTYLFEVDLSTAWDLSTATYNGVFVDISSQFGNAVGLSFKNNGEKLYVMSKIELFQYDLSSAWDLSTATYGEVNYDEIISEDSNPTGMFMRRDGRKMYMLGEGNRNVYEYDVPSTNWSLTAISYEENLFEFSSLQYKKYEGLSFGKRGEKLYAIGEDTGETPTSPTPGEVVQYRLENPYEVSSAADPKTFEVEDQDQKPTDVAFKPDGTKMYALGSDSDEVFEYNLSVPWEIESAYFSGNSFSLQSGVTSVSFRPNGNRMYADTGTTQIYQYDLSESWNVSTTSQSAILNLTGINDDTSWSSNAIKVDKNKLLVLANDSSGTDKLYEYIVGEDWNLGATPPTGPFVTSSEVSDVTLDAFGLEANPEGEEFYILSADNSGNNQVHNYKLVEYYEFGEFSSKSKSFDASQAYASFDDYGPSGQVTAFLEDQTGTSVELTENKFVDVGKLNQNVNARIKLESTNQKETPVLQSYGIQLKEDI